MRGEGADVARAAVPARGAVGGRYRVRCGEDVRPGGVAAGTAGVARDQFLLERSRLPGAADECAVPSGGWQGAGVSTHAEWFGRGAGARADRGDGELSAGGWLDPGAGSAVAIHRRRGAHRSMKIASVDAGLYRIALPVALSDSTHGTITHFELITVRLRDSDGAEGVGYTYTVGAGGAAVHALIDQGLRPVLIGADADLIESLWNKMWWRLHYGGRGGSVSLAVS